MPAIAVRPSPSYEPPWLDDDTLRPVRTTVRTLLESSPGFRALPSDQQLELARNMVRVGAYMANPDGLAKEELTPGKGILDKRPDAPKQDLVRALADAAVDQAKKKASDKIGTFAGSDFEASSVRQGVGQLQEVHRLRGLSGVCRRIDPERFPGHRERVHPADERVRRALEVRRADGRPIRAGQHHAQQCAGLAGGQVSGRSRDRRQRWLCGKGAASSPRTTTPTR